MNFKPVMLSLLFLSACSIPALYQNHTEETNNLPLEIQDYDESLAYMAEVYEIAAIRSTNKMLDDTTEYYEVKPAPKIYIKKIVKESPDLSDGLRNAQKSIKQMIEGSGTYVVTNKLEEADYILGTSVSELKTGEQPAILFKMNINNKDDQQLKAWSVVIKQMPEDKSWW